MEAALLKRHRPEACQCVLCSRSAEEAPDMALILAQKVNRHGIFCGSKFAPCPQCEGLAASYLREGLAALRSRASCQLSWQTEELEHEASEFASIYFRLIRPPGRIELWRAPLWLTEIAEIGDLVQAKAEKEIYDSISKPKR